MKKALLAAAALGSLLAPVHWARADNANATVAAPAFQPGTQNLSQDLSGNLRAGAPDVPSTGSLALGTLNAVLAVPPLAIGASTVSAVSTGIASSSATVVAEVSADGNTWTIINFLNSSGSISGSVANIDLANNLIPVGGYKFLRFRVSVAGTGTASITTNTTVATRAVSIYGGGIVLLAGANIVGYFSPSANTANGATSVAVVAAATTNATLVSTGTHNVYGLQCFTANTTLDRYIKIYNKATAPVPGTDTPITVFDIPAATLAGGNPVSYSIPTVGILTALGLGYAITTNPALADTTVLSAADTFCTLEYK